MVFHYTILGNYWYIIFDHSKNVVANNDNDKNKTVLFPFSIVSIKAHYFTKKKWYKKSSSFALKPMIAGQRRKVSVLDITWALLGLLCAWIINKHVPLKAAYDALETSLCGIAQTWICEARLLDYLCLSNNQ